jgi:hypothetical protein
VATIPNARSRRPCDAAIESGSRGESMRYRIRYPS